MRLLDASGPHRIMNGTRAIGARCRQLSQKTHTQHVMRLRSAIVETGPGPSRGLRLGGSSRGSERPRMQRGCPRNYFRARLDEPGGRTSDQTQMSTGWGNFYPVSFIGHGSYLRTPPSRSEREHGLRGKLSSAV